MCVLCFVGRATGAQQSEGSGGVDDDDGYARLARRHTDTRSRARQLAEATNEQTHGPECVCVAPISSHAKTTAAAAAASSARRRRPQRECAASLRAGRNWARHSGPGRRRRRPTASELPLLGRGIHSPDPPPPGLPLRQSDPESYSQKTLASSRGSTSPPREPEKPLRFAAIGTAHWRRPARPKIRRRPVSRPNFLWPLGLEICPETTATCHLLVATSFVSRIWRVRHLCASNRHPRTVHSRNR